MVTSTAKVVSKPPVKEADISVKRYERKYIFSASTLEDVIAITVMGNPFGFSEIYSERRVNNIYFDNHDMSLYHMNVSGDGWREKFRLRWYGNDYHVLENPVLEVKRKFGEVGEKINFPLPGFSADWSMYRTSDIPNSLSKALAIRYAHSIWHTRFAALRPTLCNTYLRRYFLSHCEQFRITLDYKMDFCPPQSPFNLSKNEWRINDLILELKYDVEADVEGRYLSQYLQARISRHSKYVRGIDLVGVEF